MVDVLGRQMFVIEQVTMTKLKRVVNNCVVPKGSGPETIILIHGFPTSSYDYHRAIGKSFKSTF